MTNDFNPDWTSPVGDTIKDLLEERGESYDDFVDQASEDTGWPYKIIEYILDGEDTMIPKLADYLAEKLGSTREFWMKRGKQDTTPMIRELISEPFDRFTDAKPTLQTILSNCLSAQIEADDYTASTHLNMAIALLSELIPQYNPDDEEMRAALEWAIDEGKILRNEE